MRAMPRRPGRSTTVKAGSPDGRVTRAALILLVALAALGAGAGQAGPTRGAGSQPERVTMIGDSVADVIDFDAASKRVLSQGIALDLQLAVCRRLVGESCPYQGARPLNVVDLLPTIDLGSTVVVEVGYNDHEDTFGDAVETVLGALDKAGAHHVLWLTLREEWTSYASMNDVIWAAAKRHPEMTVVDWNFYSHSHPDWFQPDGLHLTTRGALAMATLVHRSLDNLGLVSAPVPPPLAITSRTLPTATVGRAYAARLVATGGTRPIKWTRTAGSLPVGVHLGTDGRLTGTPRSAGRRTATLRAKDATGRVASRRFVLAVRAG